MKQLIVLCLLLFQFSSSQIKYLSPGAGVSWDLHGNFIFSPKISYGVLNSGFFFNVTLGGSTSTDIQPPNTFIEIQFGQFIKLPNNTMCTGGGFGITIPSKGGKITPRLSIFTGFILFANATVLFDDTTKAEFGSQVVLPIPFKQIEM